MPANRITVATLISTARDLGHQQAALDLDDVGQRREFGLGAVSSELDSWRKSARSANDQGVVDAVNRYYKFARSTQLRIAQAYLDGYNEPLRFA